MPLFIRQSIKISGFVIFIGLGIFLFSQTALASCGGYWQDDIADGSADGDEYITFGDCSYNCGLNHSYSTCPDSDVGIGWFDCISADTFGPGYGPDGTGDTMTRCQRIMDGEFGPDCYNVFRDIDQENVSTCYDPVDYECSDFQGSYVQKRRYCEEVDHPGYPHNTEARVRWPESINQCINDYYDDNYYVDSSPWLTVGLPGVRAEGSGLKRLFFDGGFCLDYCREENNYIVDWGQCTDYEEVVSGWDNDNCPNIRYDDSCTDGVQTEYYCDGGAAYPYNFDSSYIDGRNIGGSQETNCEDLYGPYTPASCNETCGELDSGTNVCIGADGGTCGNISCEEFIQVDLDSSEEALDHYYDGYYAQCDDQGIDMRDDVIWSQGGDLGTYGGYENELSKTNYVYYCYDEYYAWNNFVKNRSDWIEESCGDDANERYITSGGNLCCDSSSDSITYYDDPVVDDIDSSGNYCYQPNTCGNYVLDGGEECDAYYAHNKTINVEICDAYSEEIVSDTLILALGDDTNCVGADNFCQLDCTCETSSVTCDPVDYDSVNEQLNINNGAVELFHLDTQGMVLLAGEVIENNIGAYAEPAYVIKADTVELMVIDADGTLWLNGVLYEGISDFSDTAIPNQKLLIQDNGIELAVLDASGNFYIRDCMAINHSF
jgi:hypothetical protein